MSEVIFKEEVYPIGRGATGRAITLPEELCVYLDIKEGDFLSLRANEGQKEIIVKNLTAEKRLMDGEA